MHYEHMNERKMGTHTRKRCAHSQRARRIFACIKRVLRAHTFDDRRRSLHQFAISADWARSFVRSAGERAPSLPQALRAPLGASIVHTHCITARRILT